MELLLSIAQWIWNLVQPSRNGISVSPSPFDIHWSPTGLESQMLWGLFLLLPDPQAEPNVGLWTHSWERTSVIWLFPSLWVAHLEDLRSDYVTKAPLLPSHCSLFIFECKISSGRSQSFSLMIVQWLDDCALFMRGDELFFFFYSMLFYEIKRLLLIKMLTASFLSMCWPLSPWYGVCIYSSPCALLGQQE